MLRAGEPALQEHELPAAARVTSTCQQYLITVIKIANYLVPLFSSLMLNSTVWRRQVRREPGSQAAAVGVPPHAEALTNASLLFLIRAKCETNADAARGWIIAQHSSGNTENCKLGNFLTSSRRNTISSSAELAKSIPDAGQIRQRWAELEVTFQCCSPKMRNI